MLRVSNDSFLGFIRVHHEIVLCFVELALLNVTNVLHGHFTGDHYVRIFTADAHATFQASSGACVCIYVTLLLLQRMNNLINSFKATRLACITDIGLYDHFVSFDNCINSLLLLLLLLESGMRIQNRFDLVDTTCNILLLMLTSGRDGFVPRVRSQQEGLVGDYTDWLGL